MIDLERMLWVASDPVRLTTFSSRCNHINTRRGDNPNAIEGINSWKTTIRQIAYGIQKGTIPALQTIEEAFRQLDQENSGPDPLVSALSEAMDEAEAALTPRPRKRKKSPSGRNLPSTQSGAIRMSVQDVIIAIKCALYRLEAGEVPSAQDRDIALHWKGRIDSTWPADRVVEELSRLTYERIAELTDAYLQMAAEVEV